MNYLSVRTYAHCVWAWDLPLSPSPPSLFSFLSLRQLKSYNVNSGTLLPIRQARTQSIPVSLERAPNNQKRWLSRWKAAASWKDVPDENNSDHISIRRLRCLQLSATNHIRGGTGKCFGLKRSLRSRVGALFLLTVLLQNGGMRHPFWNQSRQLVVVKNIWHMNTLKEFSNYSSNALLLSFYACTADITDWNDFSLCIILSPAVTEWPGRW